MSQFLDSEAEESEVSTLFKYVLGNYLYIYNPETICIYSIPFSFHNLP